MEASEPTRLSVHQTKCPLLAQSGHANRASDVRFRREAQIVN